MVNSFFNEIGEKLDNNFYTKDCPGHNTQLDENCIKCKEDYDPNSYPNNTNCPFYKLYFSIEKIIIEELSKRKKSLDQKIIDQVVINLFLRRIINPSTKIDYKEFIISLIDEGFSDKNKREDYLNKKREKILSGEESLFTGII